MLSAHHVTRNPVPKACSLNERPKMLESDLTEQFYLPFTSFYLSCVGCGFVSQYLCGCRRTAYGNWLFPSPCVLWDVHSDHQAWWQVLIF